MVRQYFLTTIFLILSTFGFGQKIGLVLSGGGAKGVAHIGVIRALEKEGIPIHYVTGTSMGAIIGGLYAIGWSPDEMERVILSDEFQQWSTGTISDEYKLFFKEPIPNASWVNFKFRVDSVIQPRLPVNIVSPVQMDFVFLELYAAAAAAAKYDFDSLFLPFRCMASDVEASKAVVLRRGDLGNSIRASMTFPFYFKPIRIDGKMMFDGGMYNNFPVDVMYDDFFPDMIIGSKTASDFGKIRDDDILSQLEAMLTETTDFTIPCESGVLIQPEIKNVNVTDFSHTRAFIDSGYVAAKRLMPAIRSFVYDTLSQQELNKRRQAYRSKLPEVIVKKIFINGLDQNQSYYVNNLLKLGEERLPLDEVKREYFRLVTDGRIEHIFPRLRYNDSTRYFDLFLDITRNKDAIVEFGGNISSSSINNAFVGLKYRFLGKHATTVSVSSNIGRFYTSAAMEARFDFPAKIPLFIEPSYAFSRWDFFKTGTYFFEDKTPSYLLQYESIWAVNMGVPVQNRGKLVWGINTVSLTDEYYQANTFTRNDTADESRFRAVSPFVFFERSTLNAKQYPWRGTYLRTSLRLVTGDEQHIPGSTSIRRTNLTNSHAWWQFRFSFERYQKIKDHFTLGISSDVLISNQDILSNYTSTMLMAPAFQPFPGIKTSFLPKLRAHSFISAGAKNIFNLRRNLDLRLEAYLFVPYREIIQDKNSQAEYGAPFDKAYLFGTTALVFHSPIGPISFNYDLYGKSVGSSSLVFNIGYIIFNRRALQ